MIKPRATQPLFVQTHALGSRWEQAALAGLIMLALLLAFVNLPYAPRTWFDEGSHLHVPKTLVQHGVYADISSEGFRYFGPTIGVGPTVMLPIAAAFKFTGVGLLQGRLVIVAYLLLALGVFYLLARRLYGAWVALLALAL
ncbi:MAG: glycosyl transferase, partial [Chloroflexales bacterium]|nr:glycosyl transferase [Chloroflexales bacterium]